MLALLGDIGLSKDDELFEWLKEQLKKFEFVFYVPGNRESYASSLVSSDASLGEFEAEADVGYRKNRRIGFLNSQLTCTPNEQQLKTRKKDQDSVNSSTSIKPVSISLPKSQS
jgi:hypothetical protein